MENKRFVQVHIKSEADLPKEVGKYFVGFAISTGVAHYTNDNGGNKRYWLDQVDWYLQLLPEPEVEVEQLEPDKSVKGEVRTVDECIKEVGLKFDLEIEKVAMRTAMKLYASQFRSQPEMPSDEEIIIYFNNHSRLYSKDNFSFKVPVMTRGDILDFVEWLKSQLNKR